MYVAVCRESNSADCSLVEWIEFEKLHSEQYWSVSQLEPAMLASAFAAGFITLGSILMIAKALGIVLSLLK